ncbi:alpha/beta fold hydrolase [Streptomyces sp. HUAS MG47]|uniref:alpha/beta fold hydrolase n=1 Tax=Streptomyces solicamelliae TaxID=3231716 RepID=UPI003877BCB3
MRLHTTTWGSGDRVALLIHGIMSDHRTWRRVAPALAERGYRVVAVDLRGHGATGPAGRYRPDDYADDVAETLPRGAELAIGHSLGGLTLARAVERLAPRRAVYVDPAWHMATAEEGFDPELFTGFKSATAERIRALNPRWEEADVAVELATLNDWDPGTARALPEFRTAELMPAKAEVPSLVTLADPSFLISPERAGLLRERGFEVRTVAGAGHTIHRDDFDGFMASLEGWI